MPKNTLYTPAAHATWLTLVAIAGAALWGALMTPEDPGIAPRAWFIVPILWLMFAVPGAVLLHGHALSATDPGPCGTSPAKAAANTTLAAARSIWGVLVLGVIFSLVTARVSGDVSPSVWPGAVMFMLLILARPGRAL